MGEITFNPYLNFNGNTREAMEFYHKVLGGKLDFQTFGEAPMPAPDDYKDKIVHARLEAGDVLIMASDPIPGAHIWGDTFGMIKDKFGMHWMVNITKD